MASDRTRALLDSLGPVKTLAHTPAAPGADAGRSSDNPLGLRFRAGARVLDLATGRRGLVRSGYHDQQLRQETYHVALDDGRLVTRGRDELEPELAPGVTR